MRSKGSQPKCAKRVPIRARGSRMPTPESRYLMGKTFTYQSAPHKTCGACGRVYSVRIFNAPAKESDSFNCYCGEVLDKWRSTSVPEYTLKGDASD